MSSRLIAQLKMRSHKASAVSSLALSLVLVQSLSQFALAVEAPVTKKPADSAPVTAAPSAGKSQLDAQLDIYEKDIDGKNLSEGDFQKLADLAAKNPTNWRVHLLFGRGFDLQGLNDQAVEQYRLADQYGPQDPQAIVQILSSMLAKGAGEAANEMLNSAIKRFPDNPEILYMIGRRLKENKHYIEAAKVLKQAYNSGHKVLGLPTELGDLLINQEPQKAVYLAKLDLASSPDYAPALILLSKGLVYMGNYELALPTLEKLYKQAPTHEDTTNMYVKCLFWCGDFKRALEPTFYWLRANSQYVVSELRPATTLATIMSHVSPEYAASALQNFYNQLERDKVPLPPPFHFFVGRIFFRQHHLAQAKAELLRYYDSDPKSAETLWMLGNIAENMDRDYDTALKYYRLAHALLPYNATITGACLNLEERAANLHNDWALSLRDWLYSAFSSGKH